MKPRPQKKKGYKHDIFSNRSTWSSSTLFSNQRKFIEFTEQEEYITLFTCLNFWSQQLSSRSYFCILRKWEHPYSVAGPSPGEIISIWFLLTVFFVFLHWVRVYRLQKLLWIPDRTILSMRKQSSPGFWREGQLLFLGPLWSLLQYWDFQRRDWQSWNKAS